MRERARPGPGGLRIPPGGDEVGVGEGTAYARSFTDRPTGFEGSQVFRELGAEFYLSDCAREGSFRSGDSPVELTRLGLGSSESIENQWILAAGFPAHQFRERHRFRAIAEGIVAIGGQNPREVVGGGRPGF